MYDAYAARLESFFRHRVRDRQVALDLTAETLAKVYESREKFDGRSTAEEAAWIWATARNELLMFVRHHRVEQAALQRLGIQRATATPSDDPGASSSSHGDFGDLDAALESLPEAQQEVLRLRYGADLDDASIARRLGVSRDVVRARASRGLRRLSTVLNSVTR